MKIRRSLLFLAAVAVLMIALMLWYGNKQPVETPLATSPATNIASPERSESLPSVARIVHTNALPKNAAFATTASAPKPPPGNKLERMREVLSTYNDVPIDFYGKLEDQFGTPVAGAEIKGSIRIISGVRQGTDWLTTTSDANGLFQFHGKGQDISTMPSKKGYALASLNGGGNYSMLASEEQRAHPDPNNPTVIKMWKLQGGEPLTGINKHYKLPYTSAPMNFDLLTGQIVQSGGDLRITVNRQPGVISGRNRLDWSMQIEAIDGGLIDSAGQERVVYAAPDTGYQPSMSFIFSTNAPYKWFGGFNQSFFLSSRNGQVYSKLGLSFDINDAPDGLMSITFSGVANTNGSRNWEAAPNTYNLDAK